MPSATSPLMFSSGPTATSSVNIPGQSSSSSRLHFAPFCLPTIETPSSATGHLSSSSSSSIFHPPNECSSSANATAILFGNQQQQSQPSLYARYTNGASLLILSLIIFIEIDPFFIFRL
jgi:hypothetical protein